MTLYWCVLLHGCSSVCSISISSSVCSSSSASQISTFQLYRHRCQTHYTAPPTTTAASTAAFSQYSLWPNTALSFICSPQSHRSRNCCWFLLFLSLSQFLRQRRTTKERGVTSGTKCAGSATFRSEGRLKHTTITTTQPAKLPTISLSSSFASPEPNFSTTTTTAVCDIVISSQRPNTTTATMNLT